MTAPRRTPLINDLVAPGVDPTDPCALLAIDEPRPTPARVLAARDAQIAALDSHPLASTPEADDLRLALHAAASVLAADGVSLHTRATGSAPEVRVSQIVQEARLAFRSAGRKRGAAVRHVAAMAQARGIPPSDVLQLVSASSNAPHRIRARRNAPSIQSRPLAPAPAATTAPAEPDPDTGIDDVWKIAAAVAGTVLVGLPLVALGVFAVYRLMPRDPDPTPLIGREVPPLIAQRATDPPEPVYTPPQRTEIATIDELLHELRSTVTQMNSEPAIARARLLDGAAVLSHVWVDADPSAVAEANQLLTPPIRALGVVVLDQITAESDSIGARTWIAGMRAVQETLHESTPTVTADATSQTFRAGARAELDAMAQSLDPRDAGAWSDWTDALAAATPNHPRERDESAIRALTRLVKTDRISGARSLETVALAPDWRGTGPARDWLLRSLTDPGVPTPGIAAVLSVLSSSANAPGIGPTTTPAPDASFEARVDIRDRLRAAWRMPAPAGPTPLASRVADAIAGAADTARRARSREERVMALADLARVSAAAACVWRGEDARALNLLEDGPRMIADTLAVPIPLERPSYSDGTWGAAVLDAGSRAIDVQGLLLDVRADPRTIGHADARVLLNLAFRGSPSEVRESAIQRATSAPPSRALLEALGAVIADVPRTKRNARLISDLTRVELVGIPTEELAEAFHRTVMRALLASASDAPGSTRIDRGAALVAMFYAEALPATDAERGDRTDAAVIAAELARVWAAELGTSDRAARDLAPLFRATVGGPSSADPLERFVFEQQALVRVLALHAQHAAGIPDHRAVSMIPQASKQARALDRALELELVRAELWHAHLHRGNEQ